MINQLNKLPSFIMKNNKKYIFECILYKFANIEVCIFGHNPATDDSITVWKYIDSEKIVIIG